jgi:TonB family protein
MVLYSSAYRKGAYKYAYKVLELDSLNGLAHYVLGHIAEKDGNYSEAIVHYSAALRLDTTLTSIYSKLATIYLIQNEYDSALSYYRMVPYGDVSLNSIHIGEAICEIAEGNINRTQAIADRLGALETTWFVETSLENLTEYIHDYQNDRIAENDTFVFFGPFLGEKAPFQPTQWLAILTAYDIVILTDFQIEKPKQKSTPRPIYPRSAREQGIEGQVVVLAIIDVDGSVKNVEIESTSGCLALDEAALDCVRKWKFTQPRILGIHVPVESVVSVPINFRLIKGW